MSQRVALNVTISVEAHDGWRSFSMAHGATMSALAQSVGLAFAMFDDPDTALPDPLQQILRGARQIDAHRRRRG